MDAWSVPGYREERVLGAGGSGRVVLATYAETGAHVAIKYLSDDLRADPAFLAAFRDEARIMVELADPHIVRLYEYVETRHTPPHAAIVMELVDGVTLRRILAEHGATGPEAALAVLKGSLLGLARAHAAGIVHRDYKPENVLVQADGVSKLTDFGIAARTGQAGPHSGTPAYMAPEQWDGAPAGPATDVYAAACVFFECLTGHRPYRAEHRTALRQQHQSAPIPVHEVPEPLRDLVARGLAKNPADRPTTALAFVNLLEAVATAAYGADWEQRGRRRLAELATLLALLFPLATPPAPQVGTSLARTRLGGRRLAQAGRAVPRVAAGAGVLATGILIAALLAGDRQHTAALTVPPAARPGQAVPAQPATGGSGEPALTGTAPSATPAPDSGAPPEPSPGAADPAPAGPVDTVSPVPPPAVRPLGPEPPAPQVPGPPPSAAPPASAGPSPSPSPRPSPSPSPRPSPSASPRPGTSHSPQASPGTGRPSPAHSTPSRPEPQEPPRSDPKEPSRSDPKEPSRSEPADSSPPPVSGTSVRPAGVRQVTIGSWRDGRATVAVVTDGPEPVRVTARFHRVDGGRSRALGGQETILAGATRYDVTFQQAFDPVACGTVATFGVQVTSDPAAPGGPAGASQRVPGPDCPRPRVQIVSWDGARAVLAVRTGTTDPVTVRAAFRQRLSAAGKVTTRHVARSVTLSGKTAYRAVVTARFPGVACGVTEVRSVQVSTVPAGGAATRSLTRSGPPCPSPSPAAPSPHPSPHASGPVLR